MEGSRRRSRRRVLAIFLGSMTCGQLFDSHAQVHSASRPLIAWLAGGTRWNAGRFIEFLRQGLKDLGYEDGQNIEIVARYADGHVGRLPRLAAELVALRPAVIVAGAVDAAVAARGVTTTIPIVSGALADAVHLGLVANFARPGKNVTGVTPYVDGLPSKQIELAREIVPDVRRVGLLGNMNDPKAPPQRDELQSMAGSLGIETYVPDVLGPDDLGNAVRQLTRDKVDVVIALQTTMVLSERRQISALMAASRLPTVYGYREHVEDGGLISYGVDLSWCWRHVATYIDKILAGASPSDLPVQFPSKLQLAVNLGAAKALGLTLPRVILARADEVVE